MQPLLSTLQTWVRMHTSHAPTCLQCRHTALSLPLTCLNHRDRALSCTSECWTCTIDSQKQQSAFNRELWYMQCCRLKALGFREEPPLSVCGQFSRLCRLVSDCTHTHAPICCQCRHRALLSPLICLNYRDRASHWTIQSCFCSPIS